MATYYPVLSIAGSDSSGGAGIQADIKTISALGCYAMTAITALTAQNTTGVEFSEGVSSRMVEAQIRMVFEDIRPLAVKTGMLYNTDIVTVVADSLKHFKADNIVVDTVMVSTSGSLLITPDAVDAIRSRLLPVADLITPNIFEARELTGESDPMLQILRFCEMGCKNILLKGGDSSETDFKSDILYTETDGKITVLRSEGIITPNTHGTGCTLSSAIASYLALGLQMSQAVTEAKAYITEALRSGASVKIGHGHGPVNHFFNPHSAKFKES